MLNTTSIIKVNNINDIDDIDISEKHNNLLRKDVMQYSDNNRRFDIHNTDNTNTNTNNNNNTNTDNTNNNTTNINNRFDNIHVSNVNNNTILLEYNDVTNRFLFYDNNKSFLGSFTEKELVKYVISKVVPNFMQNINCSTSVEIIEKFICSIDPNTLEINIVNHLTSPFTGNIEMLIKLYKNIERFEKEDLPNELLLHPSSDRNKINDLFTNLIFTLLNHILKIITVLSDTLKSNNTEDSVIIEKFTKYSVAIVSKISNILKDKTDRKIKYIDELLEKKYKINNIRESLEERVLILEQNLNRQKKTINELFNTTQQYGGNNESYNTTTSCSTSTDLNSGSNITSNYITSNSITRSEFLPESDIDNSTLYASNVTTDYTNVEDDSQTEDLNYLTSNNTTTNSTSIERIINI